MTTDILATRPPDADVRWHDWLARGVRSDRRTTTQAVSLLVVVALALAIWLVVQLV